MADFTLFEVHLHDGFEFSPSSRGPFFGKSEEMSEDYEAELESEAEEYDIEIETEDEDESSGSRAMSMLVGLVLLVGIAAIVRFVRGRGDDDLDELADLDDREEVEIGA
ncbi:hypothetical protein GJR96_10775 [Haloferax sp. MBLA0076]|uniref:Uncharacterized protein n=1 Tax=Haloferax litoreum TaxID=2666140 RepID=A0A6A8GLA9_9EURY|nr:MULTISPECIES: hypothetical protein [Haloferax]KAB1193895.1 hypothetical protein Hfx1148_10735 [Haloferax sp. CBA1148]MRX22440.1 hypothetical protein [Haloferax litoreum]